MPLVTATYGSSGLVRVTADLDRLHVDSLQVPNIFARTPTCGRPSRTLLRGLWLAVLRTGPTVLLFLPTDTWLEWLGQGEGLIPAVGTYARINAWGVLPFLWFQVVRSYTAAHARLRAQVVVIVVANVVNFGLDWALVFGKVQIALPLGPPNSPVRQPRATSDLYVQFVAVSAHKLTNVPARWRPREPGHNPAGERCRAECGGCPGRWASGFVGPRVHCGHFESRSGELQGSRNPRAHRRAQHQQRSTTSSPPAALPSSIVAVPGVQVASVAGGTIDCRIPGS